jgi:hypothetical protein
MVVLYQVKQQTKFLQLRADVESLLKMLQVLRQKQSDISNDDPSNDDI